MEEQQIDNIALLKVLGNVVVALLFEKKRYFKFDKKAFSKKYFFEKPLK